MHIDKALTLKKGDRVRFQHELNGKYHNGVVYQGGSIICTSYRGEQYVWITVSLNKHSMFKELWPSTRLS